MQVIEGNNLANLCDYSFGDHLCVWDDKLTGTFEPANVSNFKFMAKCKEFENKVMTVFIDNIRLYPRNLSFTGSEAQSDSLFIQYLMQNNNLLELVKVYPKNKFIIFTSHEDTALDDTIQVPDNVLAIYAVNGYTNNPKVHPFPIGLQRKRNSTDNRLEYMRQILMPDFLGHKNPNQSTPTKLLYINCGIERNPEREPLIEFETDKWCTVRFDKNSMFYGYDQYDKFLSELRDHKFVVCPKGQKRGHLDCFDTHRIWETLYMRRVPVILHHPYFHKLLKGFPVLFVNGWDEITPELLVKNDYLYGVVQTMDMNKLDLETLYKNAIKST